MRILDRYYLREIIVPFAFGLALFAGIFLGIDVLYDLVKMVSQFDLSLWEALRFLAYQIVWILGYVLPMGTLLAVILAVGRLHHDGEVVAFRAAGVSFTRLMVPVGAWGMLVSLLGVGLNGHLVPAAKGSAEQLTHQVKSGGKRPRSAENLLVRMKQRQEDWLLFARRFEEERGRMEGVCILRLQGSRPLGLMSAGRAIWQGESWQFEDWEYRDYSSGRHYEVSVRQQGRGSESFRFTILPEELAGLMRSPESLGLGDLRALIETRRRHAAPGVELAPLLYEYHAKWAIPFASLGFALLAAPLALHPHRTTTSIGLGISIIVIILYELLWNILRFLGREGAFPAFLSAWLPNLFVFLVAAALIARAQR